MNEKLETQIKNPFTEDIVTSRKEAEAGLDF